MLCSYHTRKNNDNNNDKGSMGNFRRLNEYEDKGRGHKQTNAGSL